MLICSLSDGYEEVNYSAGLLPLGRSVSTKMTRPPSDGREAATCRAVMALIMMWVLGWGRSPSETQHVNLLKLQMVFLVPQCFSPLIQGRRFSEDQQLHHNGLHQQTGQRPFYCAVETGQRACGFGTQSTCCLWEPSMFTPGEQWAPTATTTIFLVGSPWRHRATLPWEWMLKLMRSRETLYSFLLLHLNLLLLSILSVCLSPRYSSSTWEQTTYLYNCSL